MAQEEIEEFARNLVRNVRDKAIRTISMQLDDQTNNVLSARWKRALGRRDIRSITDTFIPDIV